MKNQSKLKICIQKRTAVFKRKYFSSQEDEFFEDPNEAAVNNDYHRTFEQGQRHIDEVWDKIRGLTTRGLSAGAIATLTLIGSQSSNNKAVVSSLFYMLCIFVGGLLFVMFRMFAHARHLHVLRGGDLSAVFEQSSGYYPPKIIMHTARFFDYIAVVSLFVGVISGLCVLYYIIHSLSTTPQ